ncbi:putative ribonuclease H protein [Sesamum angolense]|uniref:Ribonuclease H protein n=1 Tax=Sesamum angolense TaxID=2727404 RepID=A0AAE1TBE2_9LAMI|nr:putative ribonuclease H protein [Sesamum angolense]
MRNFLWKGNSAVGYPKVAWSVVCRPIEERDQGIRDILALNKALMSRHFWDVIQNNRSSIWVKWIAHTHLRHKSVWTVDVKGGSWGWRKLLRLRSALPPYIEFKIGDGESFSLWHDPWHSLDPLIKRFPRGPGRMSIPEEAKLSAVLVDGDWSWPLITDMECIEILHLLPTVHNGNNPILWHGGNFSTKVVCDIFRMIGPKVGWYSLLLGPCKVPRYSFVLWLAILDKLSTMDKPWLSHLGGVYVLCCREMETHEHLFFRSSYSRQCIRALKNAVRFSWPNRAWGVDITWASRRWNGRHIVKAAYRALLAPIVYHIWQERNRRVFQHIERPSSTIARIAVDEIRQKLQCTVVDEGEEGELEDGGHGAVLAAPATVPAVDEGEDGELQVGGHGAVSAAPTMFPAAEGESTMEKLKDEFNINKFFELASRVIDNGDAESMEVLETLKRKWLEKLGGELTSASRGGLRPVRSWQAAPYPTPKVLRPARRFPRWPTAEQAALEVNSAVQPSCTVEQQKIMSPWASHRPLAAAAGNALTAAPLIFEKSPRLSALLRTPTPLPATSIDDEESLLPPRPFHALAIHPPIWASSPPISDVSKVKPPSVDSMFDLKGPSHHQSPAVLSPPTSVVQPAVAGAPSLSWDREELLQQRTAAAPLPTQQFRPQPPAAAAPASTAASTATVAPAKLLPELFIGNIPLHPHLACKIDEDKIATAFHNSTRKTLNFIPPSVQNGEVIVRPSIDMIRAGSHRWNTTAVGYFLGKKAYFHHLNEFVRSIWLGVHDVKATSNGFFFFQFETIAAMEDVIEGEGLSTVASGIGRPLYPDAITRACTRLDFTRVCVTLSVNSKLPKHVVIMMPNELGGESACKVDAEYEWLPPKCTGCSSLGHSTKECPLSKPTKPAVSIYVRKSLPITPAVQELKLREQIQADPVPGKSHQKTEVDRVSEDMSGMAEIRVRISFFLTLLIYCVKLMMTQTARQGVLTNAAPQMFPHVEYSDMECSGPEQEGPPSCSTRSCLRVQVTLYRLLETRVLQSNVTRIQSGVLSRWRWFVDYAGPGNCIWIAWNDELIEVDILNVGSQFVHCRVLVHELHETILITMVYGANDVSTRRELWQWLIDLAVTIGNVQWLVGGDFNAVLGMSETGLLSLPMQGERFTWHNCSLDGRSLWKKLDRLLVNDVWMDRWPNLYYTCLTPRTSDHSPMVLKGDCRNMQRAKLQWLKGRDQCSKIFFRRVATRRANKRVFEISDDDGNEQTDPTVISSIFVDFFQDKAPGPDGFSSGFFKAAWPVVGEEVSKAIIDFFKTGRLLKQLNATLLTLIPKVRNPHSVAEFRPISCCNVIYKVITKIIVSRIGESLDLLISPSQNAFVPGRQISDNILLAQQRFSGYNQCRLPPRCALKVDLRKAYDTVE